MSSNAHALYGEGRGGSDTLLLYGSDGGMEWYASISIPSTGKRAGCAILYTPDAWDDGDAILFAFSSDAESDAVVGIKLPKADKWDEDIDSSPMVATRIPSRSKRPVRD